MGANRSGKSDELGGIVCVPDAYEICARLVAPGTCPCDLSISIDVECSGGAKLRVRQFDELVAGRIRGNHHARDTSWIGLPRCRRSASGEAHSDNLAGIDPKKRGNVRHGRPAHQRTRLREAAIG